VPIYKIIVRGPAIGTHEILSVFKDKNTVKAAYEYGQELAAEVLPGMVTWVQVEEQPAA
jgi:hypothetical protein